MAWTIELDPAAAISGRTAVSLTSGPIATEENGIDWGEAAIKAFLAEQLYGEAPSDFRVPNRIVTLPLGLGMGDGSTPEEEEEGRQRLQAKVALFQRRGGVLLRQRAGKAPLYADVVNASLTLPDRYGETGDVEPGGVLKLECLPDFYGDEIALDDIEEDGQVVQVLQKAGQPAVIEGDYPARTRIQLTNTSANDQKGVLWGLRSTHYDAAPSAALAIDAKDMTPINGAAVALRAGSYSGEAMELAEPEVATWHPFMTTDLAGPTQLSHIGNYRVWARVWAPATGQQLRLAWSTDDATQPVTNAHVGIQGEEEFSIMDLGEISISEPPIGGHWWRGFLQAYSLGVSPIVVDRIWFQPLDDGAGRDRATGTPAASLLNQAKSSFTFEDQGGGHAPWTIVDPNHPGWATARPGEGGNFTNPLLAKDLGFAIPSGVTITGIKVDFTVGLFVEFPETELKVFLGEGATAKRQAINSGAHTLSYGGPTDLWGLPEWKPSQINAEGWGPYFEFFMAAAGKVGVYGAMTVTVYFSFSVTGLPDDAIIYASRRAEIRFDGAYREDTGTEAYVRVSQELGDLPRLPPSGLEGLPVEIFLKNSRGQLNGDLDVGIDSVKAKVLYRPCYIGRI